jgi:hypothetical protein
LFLSTSVLALAPAIPPLSLIFTLIFVNLFSFYIIKEFTGLLSSLEKPSLLDTPTERYDKMRVAVQRHPFTPLTLFSFKLYNIL